MLDKNWQFELEEYIKQGEPDRVEKSEAWQTAIGLQAVDGLNTSEYLLDTAKEHIEGKITIDEAQKRIHSYYEQRSVRTETENETKEADIVSARITKLLGEKAFQFSPAEWITVHRRLFEGVFDHAGQIRQYNITKKEWVLNGDTVIYADWNSIKETLDYDFATEKQFSYEGLSVEAADKLLVGKFQCIIGIDFIKACRIDEAEHHVAEFSFRFLFIHVGHFLLKFTYFFFHFIPNLFPFFPVEAYIASFVLNTVSLDKRGQGSGHTA